MANPRFSARIAALTSALVSGAVALASCTPSIPTTPEPWSPSVPTTSADPVPETVPADLGAADVTPDLLGRTSFVAYETRMAELSGELPVTIGGESTRIRTRSTEAMFSDDPEAIEYLLETVSEWVPEEQVTRHEYLYSFEGVEITAENIIVSLPGVSRPDEKVLLTGHVDAWEGSPGADDNASGSATLLEAVRLLRLYRFERTIEFVWFTGEEQGIQGSLAYVADQPLDEIVAVLNLDVLAYDSDGDRCADINVGSLPESQRIGNALVASIEKYDLGLTYDYVVEDPAFSDQVSFWRADVGAALLLQNWEDQGDPAGCAGKDRNPAIHTPLDSMAKIGRAHV